MIYDTSIKMKCKSWFSFILRFNSTRYRNLQTCISRNYSRQSDDGDSDATKRRYLPRRMIKRFANEEGYSVQDVKTALSEMGKRKHLTIENVFPSDIEESQQEAKRLERLEKMREGSRVSRYAYRPEGVDPEKTSIILFPGQGSQFVGMGKKIIQYPQVRQLYDTASERLGYNLLDLCLHGPKETLDKTEFCQPAVFVTSLGAIEALKLTNPEAFDHVIATAGFSLGEITACVFAGVLSLEDALHLISVRAKAMQQASEEVDSGMITLKLFYASRLGLAIDCAIEYCKYKLGMENPVVRIANYLSPDYQVVAGNNEALEFIVDNAEDFNLRSIKRLPVSGAFHTQLMNPARAEVRKVIPQLTINPPKFPVHTNINGKAPTKIDTIKRNLADQIVHPVSWIQTMMILYRRHPGTPFPQTYECGPGKQLGHLLYLTNRPARKNYHKIEV